MSTPVHETTYISITTSPPTTEILTTTETSTITTTVRIVDATIALDKVEHSELIPNITHSTSRKEALSCLVPRC